jgi:hypothetical protein
METNNWWESRRDGEATHSYLSRVLSDLGAHSLALKAELCHYDDYLCPDDIDDGLNINRLCNDLGEWARAHHDNGTPLWVRALHVRDAAMRGEFDSTSQESRTWALSLDGQRTFRDLFNP